MVLLKRPQLHLPDTIVSNECDGDTDMTEALHDNVANNEDIESVGMTSSLDKNPSASPIMEP